MNIDDKDFDGNFLKERQEWLENLPNVIKSESIDLEARISKFDSFNIIANIFVKSEFSDPNNYHDKLRIAVEYITLLCLKKDYAIGDATFLNSANIINEIDKIDELALSILSKSSYLNEKIPSANKRQTDIDKISKSITSEEYFVRTPAIDEHHWTVIEELYSQYNHLFIECLGYDAIDAIDLCISIADFILERYKISSSKIGKWKNAYWEIAKYKQKGIIPKTPYPEKVLQEIVQLKDAELRTYFMQSALMQHQKMLGECLSFTARDLADFSEIEISKVEHFLNSLSMKFGEMPSDFYIPTIIHPLKEKPIVKHENRYICSSLSLLDYSIDKIFEKTLQTSKKQEKFKLTKHDYLISKGTELIASCLPGSQHYTNLNYNDGNNGELDGLVIYDNCAFFIEGKSHKITDRAKKGFVDRIEQHIDDIIRYSHSQALRASKYILNNSSVELFPKKGKKIKIAGEKIKHFFLISLSFEPIANISLYIKVSNDLNLFTEQQFPWVVSLYDLMVIAEHMESASFFIHFLYKRFEVFKIKAIQIHDELDVMAYYLKQGLFFEGILQKGKFDWISVQSLLDEINFYYFFKSGKVKKYSPKIVHHSSTDTKKVIKAIDACDLQNRTDISIFFLDLSDNTQRHFHKYVDLTRKKFRKDKELHDFSIGGDDKGKIWGMTYFIGSPSGETIKRLHQHCKFKMKKLNAVNWYGILDTGESGYHFIEMVSFDNMG